MNTFKLQTYAKREAGRHSAAPVVPGQARLATSQRTPEQKGGFAQEPEMFPRSVEMELASGGDEGMPMQDGDAFAALARENLQAFEQIDFLARIQGLIKPAHGPERLRCAEDK